MRFVNSTTSPKGQRNSSIYSVQENLQNFNAETGAPDNLAGE
jgi:hypothetical protein